MDHLRQIRFANVDGLSREALPLVNEVGLQDLYCAPWASVKMTKLAAQFVRYMSTRPSSPFTMGEIEIVCQIAPEEIRKTMTAMRGVGVIESFVCDKANAQVALTLSLLQRLQVLEMECRLSAVLPGAQRI